MKQGILRAINIQRALEKNNKFEITISFLKILGASILFLPNVWITLLLSFLFFAIPFSPIPIRPEYIDWSSVGYDTKYWDDWNGYTLWQIIHKNKTKKYL